MNRKEFFEQIKNDFFKELTADLEGFKGMIKSALPVFGTLDTEIKDNEDGGKSIKFIDNDKAQFVIAPKGVDTTDLDTDMSTVLMTIHLNKDNVITIVEHSFGMFTPANKEEVLLLASFIGKKISFE